MNQGKKRRQKRILKKDNRTVIVPMDHGVNTAFQQLVYDVLHVGYAFDGSHAYAVVHGHYDGSVVFLQDSFQSSFFALFHVFSFLFLVNVIFS